jgi:hypothetical protein
VLPTPVDTRVVETSGAELATEIARLHERLHPSATPLESRNLFHYAARPSAVHAVPRTVPVVRDEPVAVAEPVAPPVKLIGIAEDGPADAVVRTAIVSGLGDLFLVKEGDTIAARYQVGVVSSGTVELTDTRDQSRVLLALP